MESHPFSALQAFLNACRHADAQAGPVTAHVEETQLQFARDCRGHFGLLEVRNAPACVAPGPLLALAEWREVTSGRLWIGILPDQSRILWQPQEGHLRWIANADAPHDRTLATVTFLVESLLQLAPCLK